MLKIAPGGGVVNIDTGSKVTYYDGKGGHSHGIVKKYHDSGPKSGYVDIKPDHGGKTESVHISNVRGGIRST